MPPLLVRTIMDTTICTCSNSKCIIDVGFMVQIVPKRSKCRNYYKYTSIWSYICTLCNKLPRETFGIICPGYSIQHESDGTLYLTCNGQRTDNIYVNELDSEFTIVSENNGTNDVYFDGRCVTDIISDSYIIDGMYRGKSYYLVCDSNIKPAKDKK